MTTIWSEFKDGAWAGCVGWLFIFLLILWFPVAWMIDTFFPQPVADAFYPIAAKVDFALLILFLSTIGMIWLAVPFGVLFAWIAIQFPGRQQSIIALCVMCILTSLIAGVLFLGITHEDPHWIVLNRTGFSQQEVSITQGETMRFANPAAGITQRLCLATHSECVRTGKGPKELQALGVTVAPGQTVHVWFPVVGEYQVISVGRPAMLLTLHVEKPPEHDTMPDHPMPPEPDHPVPPMPPMDQHSGP